MGGCCSALPCRDLFGFGFVFVFVGFCFCFFLGMGEHKVRPYGR